MMPHAEDTEHQKRKRDVSDAGNQPSRSPNLQPNRQDITGPIKYLPRSKFSRLKLIQGDDDTFSDITSLISEYERVIDRHESLASNLGAKLTGPRLLRGIEQFFDGPIKTLQPQPFSNPINWLDIVIYARSNPKEFTLKHDSDGNQWCGLTVNGTQLEITEDDWRLIWSSALDKFPLDQPLEEDEAAELATLEILEQRTLTLYQKAEEVASRARSLSRKLNFRSHNIRSHSMQCDGPSQISSEGDRGLFSDLQADLLRQFKAASPPPSHSISSAGVSLGIEGQRSPLRGGYRGRAASGSSSRHNSTGMPESAADIQSNAYRSLIILNVDQLHKGEEIHPPCDRCRRLKIPCVKHLTACVGCTKKHAKCSWKTVTPGEVAKLRQDTGLRGNDCKSDEGGGSECSEPMLVQSNRDEDAPNTSLEKLASTTLAAIQDECSRSPHRDGIQLTTLEPPISVLMNQFGLGEDGHRFRLGHGPNSKS